MIYIHVPFCKQKCSYCNFHFSTSLELKNDFLLALKKEVHLRKDELSLTSLPSLYFGGGTPSILEVDEIKSLIDEVNRYYNFNTDIEITLEANPDDLTKEFLTQLKDSGVNRLSIGTQSFYDKDLELMNRAHNASQAEDSIKRAQDFGFENLSIDLIYGSPTSNLEIWKDNLRRAINLEVTHISSYALTVEPKTALENWIERGKINAPKDADQSDEFYYMCEELRKNGFEHYEISNFAKPGFESKHNSAYWSYQPYLGLGPSAHSYDGFNIRSWNVSNNTKYIQNLDQNNLPIEREELSDADRFNEMLMIGLRTKKGVDMQQFQAANFGAELMEYFSKEYKILESNGKLMISEDRLIIPEEHWFLADGIASELFFV